MKTPVLRLPLILLLALGVATGAHAQSKAAPSKRDSTVLPVWNNTSGKVEAVLLLEPTGEASAGARWKLGNNTLGAAFGLEAGDSLGLVCNRQSGVASSIVGLISNCAVAELTDDSDGSRNCAATQSRHEPPSGSHEAYADSWPGEENRRTRSRWLSPRQPTGRQCAITNKKTWGSAAGHGTLE